MNAIKKYWHWFLTGGIFFCEMTVLLVFRKNIYAAICDNLDLFITHLKLLADNNAFFAHDKSIEILNGISRDYLPTEFALYNILYLLLPDIYAYIAGYLIKIVLSMFSVIVLAKYLLKEKYSDYEKLVVVAGFAFAILPVYPMYGLCFASMPLILFLLIKVYREPEIWIFIALFCYPLVSYFSFFGAFILGYILIAIVFLWIRDKKIPFTLVLAEFVLAAGYVCFEYRLFGIMFGSQEETIRSTMVIASMSFKDIMHEFVDSLLFGVSHARTIHTYLVLPVCLIYFVWNNFCYIKEGRIKSIFGDIFNITILFIVFNSLVHALYYCEPLRNFVEFILPPLKGFSYGRTVFFNTFGWYFAFIIVLKAVYDRKKAIACICAVLSVFIVMSAQCEYSDFYNTVYCNLYKYVKHSNPNQLSYGEFFGGDIINQIKADIDYTPEQKACAYGFHPAMLSYNGISTIDGYCGYYSQKYKEEFRDVIAPALDNSEYWQHYYDDWACRAYLFSSDGQNTYDFGANAENFESDILIDSDKLKALECNYIFSRALITNNEEMKLELVNEYSDDSVPYKVYLYRLK